MTWIALGIAAAALWGWYTAAQARKDTIALAGELKAKIEESIEKLNASHAAELAGKDREIALARRNLVSAERINAEATDELRRAYAANAKAGTPGGARHVLDLMQSLDEDDGA